MVNILAQLVDDRIVHNIYQKLRIVLVSNYCLVLDRIAYVHQN